MVLKLLIILRIAVVPFLLERGDNMEIKNSLFGYMYGRVADMKFRYFTTEYRKIHFFFWFPPPLNIPWFKFLSSLSGLCRCGPLICPSVCYSAYWVLPEVWIQWCKGQAGCRSKGRTESFQRQVIQGPLNTHLHAYILAASTSFFKLTLFIL